MEPAAHIEKTENGLILTDGSLTLTADFSAVYERLKRDHPGSELLPRACRLKTKSHPEVFDATAGLGEDSFILAYYGFKVTLCEYNPVIFLLLEDAHKRALNSPDMSETASRMSLINGNSVRLLSENKLGADVIYLDPMFPGRQKSALVKKKFQLLHQLEMPCENEEELLNAAINASPEKIVIKRPVKGPALSGRKPTYSLTGKAVRFDCITL